MTEARGEGRGWTCRTAGEAAAHADAQPWGSLTWLASRELTGSSGLTVGRVVIHRGQQNPRHSHPNCQEVLHLLVGHLEHEVGGEWVALAPGDTLVVAAGVSHQARCVGDVDADMLVVYDAGERDFRKEP